MLRLKWHLILVLVAALSLMEGACARKKEGAGGGSAGTGAPKDLLAKILADGVIRVSTDPAYPPQSELNEETGQYEGFDIDVTTEIAARLGVKIEFKAPPWELITSGGWGDRWDMSVVSMAVTKERAQVLYFTPAYYYAPASVAVHKDNTTVRNLETDLDGKKIGVCVGSTYTFFLQKTLEIPGYTFDFIIDDAEIVTYNDDPPPDLYLGDGARLDAVISARPTLEAAIKKGKPIKIVGDPVFYEPLAVVFDKRSSLDPTSLVKKVSQIIDDMHADGTLSKLSIRWYGTDDIVRTRNPRRGAR
ncbi:MAG: transporter substrate-binding domain-containing protein [Planctomycetes bacterium]|nr:transporter substrate-binding domain-containing protein [Planctomycetota bacterium]